MRCNKPRRDGLKLVRACDPRHELDVQTIVWATQGSLGNLRKRSWHPFVPRVSSLSVLGKPCRAVAKVLDLHTTSIRLGA